MLTVNITRNAKIIYHILSVKGRIPMDELFALSFLDRDDFYMAIGWLAREGYISFIITNKKEVIIY